MPDREDGSVTPATVRFRVAEPVDEAFLEEMIRLAAGWREGAAAPMWPELERYVRGYGRPGDHGIVAVSRGRSLGAAWYRILCAPHRGYGWVGDDVPEVAIAVVADARGIGIATGLLTRLLADASAQGLSGVSLSVGRANGAHRLYRRLGFREVGEVGGSWTMLHPLRAGSGDD